MSADELLEALRGYPSPAQVVEDGPGQHPRVRYAPALAHAIDLYAAGVQGGPRDAEVVRAFAGVAPKAVRAARRLETAAVNCAADGADLGPVRAELGNVLADLAKLATALASKSGAGPHQKMYLEVCGAMRDLFALGL